MQDVGINYFNIICGGGGEVVLKMMIVGWYGGGRLIWVMFGFIVFIF